MSACRRQAVSQVGCRLMVASSAKISRPRWPAAVAGVRRLTSLRKASMSARDDLVAGILAGFSAGLFAELFAELLAELLAGLVRLLSSGRCVIGPGQRSRSGHSAYHFPPMYFKVAPRAIRRNAQNR